MPRRCWLVALLMLAAAPLHAQTTVTPTPPDFPRGTISGYLFGDWYYNTAGNPNHVYDAAGNDLGQPNIDGKNVITRDLNGLQFRRVYFQVDNDLSIKYSTRFRLEADNKSLTSDGKVGVAVKSAYMKVRNVYPRADMYFGIIATPTFENSEDIWQFRALEKTIADFRGLAPSADAGIGLKGFADAQHVVGYQFMVGNGAGNKPETNRAKRVYFSLPVHWKNVRLEPYVDYENIFDAKDKATYKVFADYDFKRANVGYEYVEQVSHKPVGVYGYAVGHSLFARWAARPTLAAVARVDLWAPDQNSAQPRQPAAVHRRLRLAAVQGRALRTQHREHPVRGQGHRRRAAASRFSGPPDAVLEVHQATVLTPLQHRSPQPMIANTLRRIALSALFGSLLASGAGAQNLTGAGATFPYPLYSKWFDVYKQKTGVEINYQSIGSGAGIQQVKAGTVDFGASDAALSDAALKDMPRKVLHFPTVAGAVVLAYNLPDLKSPLQLSPEVIVGIYLGRITTWNDKRIAAVNPGVTLPAAPILAVHRSDGSGTTNIYVNYLAAVSSEWKELVGAGTSVSWPERRGRQGQRRRGRASSSRRPARSATSSWRTRSTTTCPRCASATRPASSSRPRCRPRPRPSKARRPLLAKDVRTPIVNSPAPDAWPIAGLTFLLVYQDR